MPAPSWSCREGRAADQVAIAGLFARVPTAARALAPADPTAAPAGSWWWIALDGARVGAALGVEATTGTLVCDDPTAAAALGTALLRQQGALKADAGHRHVLRGAGPGIDALWRSFQAIGRKVVADRERILYTAPPAAAVGAGVAGPADLKVALEWLADHSVETRAFDPRKQGRDAHQRQVASLQAAGRLIVARDGAMPTAVAAWRDAPGGAALVEPIAVPLALRARRRLVAQAIAACTTCPVLGGRPTWWFADSPDARQAAAALGCVELARYRQVEMQT